jgi:hypothetical protein
MLKQQFVFTKSLQHQLHDLAMLFNVLGENENVIEVYTHHTFHNEILENVIHHGLEDGGRVSESEKHHQRFVETVIGMKCCLPLITCLHLHILVPPPHIKLSEELCMPKLIHQFGNEGERIVILDCDGVQHTIILYKVKHSLLLFDEEDWRCHGRFQRSDVA